MDGKSAEIRNPLRVAVAGIGAIGMAVAEALEKGVSGCRLSAVSAKDVKKAKERLAHFKQKIPVVTIEELEPLADLVLECAPGALLPRIIEPFLKAGKTAIVLSAGALLANDYLIAVAREHGGQIVVPSGALLGLDAVIAAAEGNIKSVKMTTRKPVRGLLGAPYLTTHRIHIENITEPMRVFAGTAREAAAGFPANVNVAAALALAGIGPDRTMVEIWADPSLDRNIHEIEVKSDSADFAMRIANIPSDNPKTGRITALSAIAYLRKLAAPLRIGS
jgi:aspartate dehydrogenase